MKGTMRAAVDALWRQIGQEHPMVLATAVDGGVAARTVDVFRAGDDLYFLTFAHSGKFGQMQRNPQVCICQGALQVYGEACSLGSPLDEKNKPVADAVAALHAAGLGDHAALPGIVLIRVAPVRAAYLDQQSGGGHAIDFAAGTAAPIKYEG